MEDDGLKFHVLVPGDLSVGIPGDHVRVETNLTDRDPEFVAFVKKELTICFVNIYDDCGVSVMTGEEFDKFTAEDD